MKYTCDEAARMSAAEAVFELAGDDDAGVRHCDARK